jgi:hypothetical protein
VRSEKDLIDINKKLDAFTKINDTRSLSISYLQRVNMGSDNLKESEIEVKKVKLLLNDMFNFLAEMPIDKYHDYREFRNLRLRGYLINKFMRSKYAHGVK